MLKVIELFVFWYPAIMSVVWIAGGIVFYLSVEKNRPLPLYETPMVSVLVPCFNEADTIENTVKRLSELSYPNYEMRLLSSFHQQI